MSSAILSLLISHILTYLEGELVKAEPQLVSNLEADIKSLISKLEALIAVKSPVVAKIATPVLNVVESATTAAVEAAGTAIAQNPSN